MSIRDLRDRLINAEVLTDAGELVADIVAGFDVLKTKTQLTDDESDLYIDVTKAIAEHGFHGRQMEAINILAASLN